MNPKTVVWRFCDGKAGHERQTAGLLEALGALRQLEIHVLRDGMRPSSALPQLAVGAGRACAWRMLLSRGSGQALRVYLMNPPLPRRLFDLCLVPRHDGVAEQPGVILTDGVLNDLRPARGPRGGPLLVLVGGPSKHHRWDEAGLLAQVAAVLADTPDTPVLISDSRRTPASTSAALQGLAGGRVNVVRHTEVAPDWLPTTLASAAGAWVSADSVSMLFEALTTGCAVGVLEVPCKREDRINRIAAALAARGMVTLFSAWQGSRQLAPPREPLAEAARCAALIDAALRAREARC